MAGMPTYGGMDTNLNEFSVMADDFPSLHTSLGGDVNHHNHNGSTDDVLKVAGSYNEKYC